MQEAMQEATRELMRVPMQVPMREAMSWTLLETGRQTQVAAVATGPALPSRPMPMSGPAPWQLRKQ
jgi:hypothetical protein